MLLGFKTELKLNNQQLSALIKHCGVARHAWNWGLALTKQILDHNRTNPDSKMKFPTAIDLHKWLVALVVVNRWFPSSKTCSNCGTKKETLGLDERVFNCNHCGFVIDRDLNAAINLSHRGRTGLPA
jgi:transposase